MQKTFSLMLRLCMLFVFGLMLNHFVVSVIQRIAPYSHLSPFSVSNGGLSQQQNSSFHSINSLTWIKYGSNGLQTYLEAWTKSERGPDTTHTLRQRVCHRTEECRWGGVLVATNIYSALSLFIIALAHATFLHFIKEYVQEEVNVYTQGFCKLVSEQKHEKMTSIEETVNQFLLFMFWKA